MVPRLLLPVFLVLIALVQSATAQGSTVRSVYDSRILGTWRAPDGDCRGRERNWVFGGSFAQGGNARYDLEGVYGTAGRLVLELLPRGQTAAVRLVLSPGSDGTLTLQGVGVDTVLRRCPAVSAPPEPPAPGRPPVPARPPAPGIPLPAAPDVVAREAYARQFDGEWRGADAVCGQNVGTWDFAHDRVRANASTFRIEAIDGTPRAIRLLLRNTRSAQYMTVTLNPAGRDRAVVEGPDFDTDLRRCPPGVATGQDPSRTTDLALAQALELYASRVAGLWRGTDGRCADPAGSWRFDRETIRANNTYFAVRSISGNRRALTIPVRNRANGRTDILTLEFRGPGRIALHGADIAVDLEKCSLTSGPGEGVRGPLPLRPGVYVTEGTACGTPPNAGFLIYDGRGLSGSSTRDCAGSARDAGQGRIELTQQCTDTYDNQRSANAYVLGPLGDARFTRHLASGAQVTYRLCPIALLPDFLQERAPAE
jgi:hypothetical protein